MIQSGAAVKIADQIIRIFGEKRALFSLALATMILTAVGVFGDVAVITVAPDRNGLSVRESDAAISFFWQH